MEENILEDQKKTQLLDNRGKHITNLLNCVKEPGAEPK